MPKDNRQNQYGDEQTHSRAIEVGTLAEHHVHAEMTSSRGQASVMKQRLEKLVEHLRSELPQLSDAKGKVLFEIAAEVLTGLATAFEHYEKGSEEAMK